MIGALVRHTTMAALVGGARVLAIRMPVAGLVRVSDRLAELVEIAPPESDDRRMEFIDETRRLASRVSRIIPGATCLHRALAGRVWLAGRGVGSRLVVGFRRRDQLEGHAWLAVETDGGHVLLFVEEQDGFTPVWTPA